MPPDTSKPAPTLNGDASAAPEPAPSPSCDACGGERLTVDPLLHSLLPVFDRAFADIPHVVLAVSGGSDSMALMHLAAAWLVHRRSSAQATQLPTISVVTVDHALRPQAAAEAAAVAAAADRLGLPHTTLVWRGPKPQRGIQAAARVARYQLIRHHLAADGTCAVAMAHTIDDQAETVLMRLARGSGVEGLAAMRAARSLAEDCLLLRPLLGVAKADLTSYLQAHSIKWSEDPSNQSEEFERVRVRQFLLAGRRAGFAPSAISLARTAHRAARAHEALEAVTTEVWEKRGHHARFDALGYAELHWEWLLTLPEEIRLRLLAGLVNTIGGQDVRVSLGRLEALTVENDWRLTRGATLHSTQWNSNKRGRLRIFRETDRRELPVLELMQGVTVTWDRRFVVSSRATGAAGLCITALGPHGLAAIVASGQRRPDAPARALWTQPALHFDDRLVAAPTLGFAVPGYAGLYHCEPCTPRFATRG